MKRLLTAAIGVPAALFAVFRFPEWAFLLLLLVVFEWAAIEFLAMVRPLAPEAPWRLLLVSAPLAAVAIERGLSAGLSRGLALDAHWLLLLASAIAIVPPVAVLLARTPIEQTIPATAILAWGTLYFAAPVASLVLLQQLDPWIFFLLLAIVWLGDTAAYYVGSAWGRHRLAPVVSPKKSWEGAIAGLATSLAATAIWSLWRLDAVDPALLAVALATAIASQLGDLVESLVKRAANVKDSGAILPGHGGMFDRFDAMFLAAPVMLLGLWIAGFELAR
ncbi:MAG: phosphatidate cytidylyltransferase [Thermoanaerobaculia bacterium]|jgi:phosphatidate cytidylyltransferase|nr:phosphatidate cytidylyltransferase [Thermoanaerobaculia bacterium]